VAKEEKGGKKTPKPGAFSQFYKKQDPRDEIKSISREEKRRKENPGEDRSGEFRKRKFTGNTGSEGPRGPRGEGGGRFGRNEGGPRGEGGGRFGRNEGGPRGEGGGRFGRNEGGPRGEGGGRFGRNEGGPRGEGGGRFGRSSDAPFERRSPQGDLEMRFDGKDGRRPRFKKDKSPEGIRKRAERSLANDLEGPIRLNRFIALSGVCSRREADELIAKGQVTVNGEVVTELGVKVTKGKDVVVCNGKELSINTFVYLLMNKPKNMISTTEDDMGRQTVMDLVHKYTSVRIYPVGRLDRNTTGLLLFTNDGALAKKLMHPSHEVQKIYHARLDKPVNEDHLAALRVGIELEDGFAQANEIEYVDGGGRFEVGLRIHIGRNRIVRRMFEHFGYEVESLDRVQFGPLTKIGLPRGKCRLLDPSEVGFLKMMK
jgi:23S rRNA pseudouridine2605 synthase